MGKRISIITICNLLFLTGCSSVKLSNTYRSDDFDSINGKKVLVVSRTPQNDIRMAYELQLVEALRKKGVAAGASHIEFQGLENDTNKTDQRIARIVAMFRQKGYDIILLTSLKDIQEQEILQRKGGHSSLMEYYGNQYVTLKGYYDDVSAPPKLGPIEIEETTTVQKVTTYVLEAVIYNLALKEDQRLVSIITAEVSNPNSEWEVRKGFVRILTNQFK